QRPAGLRLPLDEAGRQGPRAPHDAGSLPPRRLPQPDGDQAVPVPGARSRHVRRLLRPAIGGPRRHGLTEWEAAGYRPPMPTPAHALYRDLVDAYAARNPEEEAALVPLCRRLLLPDDPHDRATMSGH